MSTTSRNACERLTMEEALAEAARLGLDVPERTFRYYALQGLLPKAEKGGGDARLRYYPRTVLQRLADIRSLQGQGYTLKQINDYFGVTAEVAAGPGASRATPAGDPLRLLRALAGPAPARAARAFVTATALDPGEATLRREALRYYEALLGLWMDPQEAARGMQDIVAASTPLELEALTRPLRAWRDREAAGRAAAGGLPLARHLRALAQRRMAGEAAARSLVEVAGWIDETRRLSDRLEAAHREGRGFAARVAGWAGRAAADLCAAADRLREARQAEALVAAVVDVEEADQRLGECLALLRGYVLLAER